MDFSIRQLIRAFAVANPSIPGDELAVLINEAYPQYGRFDVLVIARLMVMERGLNISQDGIFSVN